MKPKKYRLTETGIVNLTQAMHNPKLFKLDGSPLLTAEERCNAVWIDIASVRNVDWQSITPILNMDFEYFMAQPLSSTKKEQQDGTSRIH